MSFNTYGHLGAPQPHIQRGCSVQHTMVCPSVELGHEGEVIIENGALDPATFVDNGDGTQGPGGVDHEFEPPAFTDAILNRFGIEADERGRMLLLGGAVVTGLLAIMAFRRS
jgi:hypothetical protein